MAKKNQNGPVMIDQESRVVTIEPESSVAEEELCCTPVCGPTTCGTSAETEVKAVQRERNPQIKEEIV